MKKTVIEDFVSNRKKLYEWLGKENYEEPTTFVCEICGEEKTQYFSPRFIMMCDGIGCGIKVCTDCMCLLESRKIGKCRENRRAYRIVKKKWKQAKKQLKPKHHKILVKQSIEEQESDVEKRES